MVEFSGWVFGSDLMLTMNEFVMLTMGSPDNPTGNHHSKGTCRPNPSEVLATDLGLRLHPKNSSQILI